MYSHSQSLKEKPYLVLCLLPSIEAFSSHSLDAVMNKLFKAPSVILYKLYSRLYCICPHFKRAPQPSLGGLMLSLSPVSILGYFQVLQVAEAFTFRLPQSLSAGKTGSQSICPTPVLDPL